MTTKEKNELLEMLGELESHRLEVILSPAKEKRHEGHCVRVLADQNPKWYRDFCACYYSTRKRCRAKHDTLIKRENTLSILRTMLAKGSKSKYVNHFLSIARERIKRANNCKIVYHDFSAKKRLQVCGESFSSNPF